MKSSKLLYSLLLIASISWSQIPSNVTTSNPWQTSGTNVTKLGSTVPNPGQQLSVGSNPSGTAFDTMLTNNYGSGNITPFISFWESSNDTKGTGFLQVFQQSVPPTGPIGGYGFYDVAYFQNVGTSGAIGHEVDTYFTGSGAANATNLSSLFADAVIEGGSQNYTSSVNAHDGNLVHLGTGTIQNGSVYRAGPGITPNGGIINYYAGFMAPDQLDRAATIGAGFLAFAQTNGSGKAYGFYSDITNQDHFGIVTAASYNGFAASGVLYATSGNTDTVSCPNNTSANAATGYTLPADYLTSGKVLRVVVGYSMTTSGSPPTMGLVLSAGSTHIWEAIPLAPAGPITDRSGSVTFYIQGTAASGASVAVYTSPTNMWGATSGSLSPLAGNQITQPVNLATNGTLVVKPGLFCNANTAGNSITIQQFIIEALN